MKMVLADLASECFDENIELGEYNEVTANIQRRVLAQIKDDQRRKHFAVRQALSIALVAAVLVSLLTVVAYALGLFQLNVTLVPTNYTIHGQWIERDDEGNVIDARDMYYPGANLVFTFDCEEKPHYVEFRPGWLPSQGWGFVNWEMWSNDLNDWYTSFSDDGESAEDKIYYQISSYYAAPDFQLVLQNHSEIVEQTNWNNYEVIKVINYNDNWGEVNYVLLFDPENGYLIRVGGCISMEDIEHIAKELEVRVTDKEYVYDPDFNIAILDIARG